MIAKILASNIPELTLNNSDIYCSPLVKSVTIFLILKKIIVHFRQRFKCPFKYLK